MVPKSFFRKCLYLFLVLSGIFFLGALFIFIHSYYLESYFNVHVFHDPRWRIYNFNSRQATEGEIYNVSEVPAIHKVSLAGNRKLRFEFTPPVKAPSWKILDAHDRSLISEGKYPEIQFPDTRLHKTYLFIPEGVTVTKEMSMEIDFYPTENYAREGLSWDDNYYTPNAQIPFSLKKPYSIYEWAGIPDNDPEIIEAKRIMGNAVDINAPLFERSEQVFSFIQNEIKDSGGAPSDEVQEASPLETYKFLSTGKGKGFCENTALVYYIFANAAGIPTRLVDRAGKFGPLKLTGHYFCESWIPEYAKWIYVDPTINIANVTNTDGMPLHTVDLKKLFDLHALTGCTFTRYDRNSNSLIKVEGEQMYERIKRGLTGEIVFAYKFGYGNNKSYSKVKNFLSYTTLLYAPYTLPKLYFAKYIVLKGFWISLIITLFFGLVVVITGRKKQQNTQ